MFFPGKQFLVDLVESYWYSISLETEITLRDLEFGLLSFSQVSRIVPSIR